MQSKSRHTVVMTCGGNKTHIFQLTVKLSLPVRLMDRRVSTDEDAQHMFNRANLVKIKVSVFHHRRLSLLVLAPKLTPLPFTCGTVGQSNGALW